MARRAWDQRTDESDKAYDAFATYRDMGVQRSNVKVAETLGKSVTLMNRWSGAYAWVERARLYDSFIAAEAQKKTERDAITRKAKMLERHAGMGRVLQSKALEHLQKTNSIDKATDAIAAAKLGVEMERKAEGLPEWILEVVNADETELTRQYNGLLAEIGGYRGGDETAGDDATGQDASSEAASESE